MTPTLRNVARPPKARSEPLGGSASLIVESNATDVYVERSSPDLAGDVDLDDFGIFAANYTGSQ